MKRYETVDDFIEGMEQWSAELSRLREILLSTELEETVKWGAPCYTYQGKNVVGIGGFKSYFGLWFHQGALLSDPESVLINAQEGTTKALRQWRMESKKDIKARVIKAYVKESIQLQEQGKQIKPTRGKSVVVPDILQEAFDKNKKAATSFASMTLGKQREYTTYIDEAKRDATKLKRIDKILPMIIDGVGLNDRYRNC